MKFSKKIMMTVFICFFVSGTVFTMVSSKELKINIDNAVQTVQNIILYAGTNESRLTVEDEKLKIFGDNFVINSGNEIISGGKSSILGGIGNIIENGNSSTILGGEGNRIESDNSFIGGGSGNSIYYGSTGSVVMGGDGNVLQSENSVVIGNNNEVDGSHVAVIGNNNKIILGSNNSVAMGSGAIVNGKNSFLWSDGGDITELNEDNVFVVMSEYGMVVGDAVMDAAAKLNVGGLFVISTGDADKDIQCGNEKGVGTVKMVDRDDIPDQKCLCSCNGENWISMLGDGQCESICKGETSELFPGRPEGKGISIIWSGDKRMFSGGCLSGTVIEGSYYLTGNTIYWVCQSKNGNVATFNYESKCKGSIPANAKKNNDIVPSIEGPELSYSYNEDKRALCSYSCKEGYAYYNGACQEVCDKTNKGCNFGSYIPGLPTLQQAYTYECVYGSKTYNCAVKCDNDKIWNGSNCVYTGYVCGAEKYTCLQGNPYNTGTDIENFTWKCKSDDGTIGAACSKPKERVNRTVFYSNNVVDANWLVYFYVENGDITRNININLEYKNYDGSYQGKQSFTIPAMEKSSKKETFARALTFSRPKWGVNTGCKVVDESLYVPVGEKLYILKIQDDRNFCLESCSTAGRCVNGSVLVINSLTSNLGSNEAKFSWKCAKNGTVKDCSTSCEVDNGQCETMPANAVSCDASNDSNCKILKGDNILLNNFYMDVSKEIIVSSKCGDKRYCAKNAAQGYITCINSRETCQQPGFKCKEGYVLSGCECKLDVCDNSKNPGGCKAGFSLYPGATWTGTYDYRCQVGAEIVTCKGKCDSEKVWNGTGCVMIKKLCATGHYNCQNGARAESTQYVSSKNKYIWTCKLGDSYESCTECGSGYVSSGDVCEKIKIGCEAEKFDGYDVPFLKNGTQTGVQKYTRNSMCDGIVKCEAGELKKISENCKNVCNTGTYLGTCITGSTVMFYNGVLYNGKYGESGYNYVCRNGEIQQRFADTCYAKCPIMNSKKTYWSGDHCEEMNFSLCSGSHYNCINGGKLVPSSSSSVEKVGLYETTTTYTWKCGLGDLPIASCSQEVTEPNECKRTTTGGYTIKTNANPGAEVIVTKTTNGQTCTGTFVCQTGTWALKNEICTKVCPGGILDAPKCNYGGSPSSYQSATWTSGYTYKCGGVVCTGSCPNNKIWNGSACVNPASPCNNGSAGGCNQGNSSTVSNGTWGTTWNCKDINGNNLNTGLCYKCNNAFGWNSTENKCNPICRVAQSTNPCDIGYTATGQVWGNGYNLWGTNYLCKSGSQSVQCSCPEGFLWNGIRCGSIPQDICVNEVLNTCNIGYPVNQKTIEGGHTWTCKTAQFEKDCHKCDDGEWNDTTKTCKLQCAGGDELPAEAYEDSTKHKYVYNSIPSDEFTEWYCVDSLEEYNSMDDKSCSWTCATGYILNANKTQCISSDGCGDRNDYGGSPWMHEDKLCANGWTLSTSYRPRITWRLNGSYCEPTFTWQCKKSAIINVTKICKETEINTRYVGVGINNPYDGSKREIYFDGLYDKYHQKKANADGITARMGYYNTIEDGPVECGFQPSDEIFYNGFSMTPVKTSTFDNGGQGYKIHNFNYSPTTYMIDGVSYVLSTLRPTSIGEFDDYICHNVTVGDHLYIFSCPNEVTF